MRGREATIPRLILFHSLMCIVSTRHCVGFVQEIDMLNDVGSHTAADMKRLDEEVRLLLVSVEQCSTGKERPYARPFVSCGSVHSLGSPRKRIFGASDS